MINLIYSLLLQLALSRALPLFVLQGHSANFTHQDQFSHNEEHHLVCEYRCNILSVLLEGFLKSEQDYSHGRSSVGLY